MSTTFGPDQHVLLALDTAPLLAVEGLGKRFGDFAALDGVSFGLHAGTITGLLGPNGAGKTTLLSILVGLLPATGGSIRLEGVSYRSLPPEAKSIIGFVPDSQEVIGSLSGNEYLQFLRGIYRLGEEEWAAVAGWAELLKIGPQLDQLMETYSHGQRKKVQLIGALLHRPALLLLDEPLSGLDPEMAAIVKALLRGLRERGVGVLLSTHDLLAAEALCDRALFLDQGRIVASGECEALRARYTARNLEDAFLSAIGVADRLSEVEHVLAGF